MKILIGFSLFALFAVLVSRYFMFAIVNGRSMLPTLQPGKVVLVSNAYWLFGEPKRNDIVVLNHQGRLIVKRLDHFETLDGGTAGIYVLGDNSIVSEDSALFGPVPKSEIVGKLLFPPRSNHSR